ncbi:MAG: hypothetical protein CMQ41_00810 [Gammaproteobacteria bacterium]|nr:hypothetical protein [Gammaproteobacteria bacterium]
MGKKKLTIEQAMSQAKEATNVGNVQKAVKIYSAILKRNPNFAPAKESLQKLNKSPTDKHTLPTDKPLELSADKINGLIELYNQGNLLMVEAECKKILKSQPKELTILNLLGAAQTRQMKYKEAIVTYEKAIQLNPSFVEAYLNLASSLTELGKHEEAALNCKKAIKLNPKFAEAHCVLGQAQKTLEQSENAIKSFKKALQLKPGFPEAYIGLGNIYLRQGLVKKGLHMKQLGQHVICFDPDSGVSILRGEQYEKN